MARVPPLGRWSVTDSPVDCIPAPPQGDEGWCPSSPSAAHSWPARWGTWTGRWAAETPGSTRAWVPHPTRSSYWDSKWEICRPVNNRDEIKKPNTESMSQSRILLKIGNNLNWTPTKMQALSAATFQKWCKRYLLLLEYLLDPENSRVAQQKYERMWGTLTVDHPRLKTRQLISPLTVTARSGGDTRGNELPGGPLWGLF